VNVSPAGDVFVEPSRFDDELEDIPDLVANSGNERMECILVSVNNLFREKLKKIGHGKMGIEAEFHSSDILNSLLPILTAAIINKQSVNYQAYRKELRQVRRIKFSTTV
jgi:hypothetical protein